MRDRHWLRAIPLVLGLLLPSNAKNITYSSGTDPDGVERQLASDRAPLLHSEDFGDCLKKGSLLNVTKFDAALYRDNSTLAIHLDGETSLESESVTLFISVEAYGGSYFQMAVDPCFNNIASLCPMRAGTPITAFAPLNVTADQVNDMPKIAFDMPDFDGYAKIWIIANASQAEIGCFQAAMSNGASFAQPKIVGSILGFFTAVAIIASFIASAYGVSIPHMSAHYAHSISVLVIFETFQTIFFSGALSIRWPRILTAWWSNFAWASGLITVSGISNSINLFAGVDWNVTQVGRARNTTIASSSGLNETTVRSLPGKLARDLTTLGANIVKQSVVQAKRQSLDTENPYDYTWSGEPINSKMPLPGDWSGFSGTLSALGIPVAEALLIALIWLLILLGAVVLAVVALKVMLEGLVILEWIRRDRLQIFRSHWQVYIYLSLMRTLIIASFPMSTLAILQLKQTGRAGPVAVGAVVLAAVVLWVGGMAIYALWTRLRFGKFISEPKYVVFRQELIFGWIPCPKLSFLSPHRNRKLSQRPAGSLSFARLRFRNDDPRYPRDFQNRNFIKRFGWLTARYRPSKWWYYVIWLTCQLVRACFIAGATTFPLVQIFGVFLVDVFSLVVTVALDPYEGRRNTALTVWLLGLAKITITGLSIAFLPDINTERVLATVIGLIIIVIQIVLIVSVMALVALGVISSWMSLTRNQEYFSPRALEGIRIQYFKHIAVNAGNEKTTQRKADPKAIRGSSEAEEEFPPRVQGVQRNFSVTHVRRVSKIEDEAEDDDDEDADSLAEMPPLDENTSPGEPSTSAAAADAPPPSRSRTNSLSQRHSVSNLPRAAARVHRTSWSSRDFTPWQGDSMLMERPNPALVRALSGSRPRPRGERRSVPGSEAAAAERVPPIPVHYREQQQQQHPVPSVDNAASTPGPRVQFSTLVQGGHEHVNDEKDRDAVDMSSG
jgi:hypothetical protein